MRDARQHYLLEISRNLFETFGLLGRASGESRFDIARLDLREDRVSINMFQVIDYPVNGVISGFSE
jgi:hypothetical protein